MMQHNPTPRPLDAAPPASLRDGYPSSGAYDEMRSADGTVRPHWEYLMAALDSLGEEELRERGQEIRRLLRDNGVTYNAYGDPRGITRPWQLDPLPLLMPSQEWVDIERGLLQRAELLNLLLRDLYGPAESLKKGLLPPELIYTQIGFLRNCVGLPPPAGRYLHLYAADIIRSAEGRLYVVGDRPGSLSGVGYALENRMVLSRVFPSLFRDSQVHRLAMFFRGLRQTIHNLAWQRSDNLRIVVLTPGPDSEAYFEHAYLARYLGYTLVQGSDLTVREGRVWLKSLDGLQPVHVIMRWVASEDCDPLELRADSALGVAGLVQAARMRNVACVNPLGGEVVENRALFRFLPALAKHFLGEDLLLPSPRTWWCGLPKEREYVLANLDHLVIRRAVPTPSYPAIDGASLAAAQLEKVRAEILAQPNLFVGQEALPRSSAPIFTGHGLEPRNVALRTFMTASEGGYQLMPGGLARVASEAGAPVSATRYGGLSKDTWLLASEPEKHDTLVQPLEALLDIDLGRGELPSRVAESLFWLGRYAERAEGGIRLLRTVLLALLNPLESYGGNCLNSLLRAVTALTETYPGFLGEDAENLLRNPEHELMSVFLERARMGSLSYNLDALLYAARSARDRISPDIWRVFNDIEEVLDALQNRQRYQSLNTLDPGGEDALNDAQEQLDNLVLAFAAFNGLVTENMTHGQGWRFMIIGRRLERAQLTTHLLQATLCHRDPEEAGLLEQLLQVCDSLLTYRTRYRTQVRIEAVLDLLLQDETNPRSLSYQLERLQYFIAELPRDSVFAYKSQEERLVLEALSQLRLADPRELAKTGGDGAFRPQLDQLLVRLSNLLPRISDAVSSAYFSHTERPRQLVEMEGGSQA